MALQTRDGVPVSDGFDFPVGPRKPGTDVFDTHKVDTVLVDPDYFKVFNAWHPGEDWNGRGGGDTDLGDPIYAVSAGRVVDFGDYAVWGKIVLLEHVLANGSRVWSQYAHLQEIMVANVGQKVKRGEQIGTMGKGADNRYRAHLHFEIRKNSLPINNWSSVVKDRQAVVNNYFSPTDFIRSQRPRRASQPGSPTTSPVRQPSRPTAPVQIIVGPLPGNIRAGAFQHGGANQWRVAKGGFGSDFFSTPTSARGETQWGQWTPASLTTGVWEIWAYIPGQNATSTYARYRITHKGGQTIVPINQAGYNNAWAILGRFELTTGQGTVRLSNFTGELGSPRLVGFDTICWHRVR